MTRNMLSSFALAALVFSAGSTLAAGPRQQVRPDLPQGTVSNSVVRLNLGDGRFSGTGTVIDKKKDANNDWWVTVLTADHNTWGNNVPDTLTDFKVRIGDSNNGAVTKGGALGTDSLMLTMRPGGVDVALISFKYGAADARLNNLAPAMLGRFVARNRATPDAIDTPRFTQMGFGGTGDFENGGMPGVNDSNTRRFQNNRIERWVSVTTTADQGGYNYDSIQWDFNAPTALADDNVLVGEGLSFVGDSGGPYFSSSEAALTTQQVATFRYADATSAPPTRFHVNADGTGAAYAGWDAGDMNLWGDRIMAVHTRGNSRTGALNRFDVSNGAGVPLTQDVRAWIDFNVAAIPAPGPVVLTALGGMIACRRRRA